MPIGSFIEQPAADDIKAAYRPIVIRVAATNTDSTAIPPVVYCDIYLDDIFYKTLSMTQYTALGSGNSQWEFDVQDALQEYLGKFLAENGEQGIVQALPLVAKVLCKLRSSGLDSNGFIQPEGTVPIQATGSSAAVAGTGTSSNAFYAVNATLQHEDNQDLADHLDSYKHRTWDTTYPLTHRPDRYKLCPADSDSFPILTDKIPAKLVLHYIPKGESEFITGGGEEVCIQVSFGATPALPNAEVDEAYDYEIPLLGTGPFSISGSPIKPAWMTIAVVGSNLEFSGTPDAGDIASNIQVKVTVENCASKTATFTNFINVTSMCVDVAFATTPVLPDAMSGKTYSYSVGLTGTGPFSISGTPVKPAWMSISIVGSNLVFSGTPSDADIDDDVVVQVAVQNCGGLGEEEIDTTIDVFIAVNYVLDATFRSSIDEVTGTGVPTLPPTGIDGTQSGHHTGISGDLTVSITHTLAFMGKVFVVVNGNVIDCKQVLTSGDFTLSPGIVAESDQVRISTGYGFC